jgi:short-subunit dehydrogenase
MAAKTYFITGASRGLGLEFVTQLKRAGHVVIATARKPESSEGLQKLVDNKQVYSIALDTVDVKSVEAAVEKVNEIAPNGIDVSCHTTSRRKDQYPAKAPQN